MAAMGGFDRPIMHGLCTYGIASRVVYDKYCDDDPTRMSVISARFTSHVFPGETLIVETFKEGNTVHFTAKTKERGKVAIIGIAELKPEAKL